MNRGIDHAGAQETDQPTDRSATPDASRFLDRRIGRGGFLRTLGMGVVAAISASACSKLDKMFPREGAERPDPTVEPEAVMREPNIEGSGNLAEGTTPQFLEQDLIRLKGLPLLMAQPQIDRYIFNSVSGNKAFTNVAQVHKDQVLNLDGSRSYTVPYHAFVFKAFDEKSNVNLPRRLGSMDKHQS